MERLLTELSEGVTGLEQLRVMIEADTASIALACVTTEARLIELNDVINLCIDKFGEFVGITSNAFDILECQRINGIFVDFYHDALCTNGPYAFMWIFITMMAVYGLGMAMILFRGALLPADVRYDEDDGFYEKRSRSSESRSRGGSETDNSSHDNSKNRSQHVRDEDREDREGHLT